ncbi:MAG: YeeE/YedE family protein [Bdellovibrionaceae bacterium]|nr:YeeE/YedE family protein [Pseudobdellovibrionaceae bacterium]
MKNSFFLKSFVAFIVGFIFSIGLAISRMTQPQKVIGFLNPFEWDPSLLFVMVGALTVHIISYALIKRRHSPLLDSQWHVPSRKDITMRLLLGSAIFGFGWGLGGFCPGPGVTSLVSGDLRAVLFVLSMLAGMILFKLTAPYIRLRE